MIEKNSITTMISHKLSWLPAAARHDIGYTGFHETKPHIPENKFKLGL